ncbi:class A beta-lactamase, subclass A2 [Solitalea canadensis]|uniref:Beta-lactamase n=1 Tax=Solitalea canadensis (strain ATCC 29591 / DSM 3403 / JCM 21819 / LMG 8368 / NBRC 15130 / NCIMB 12057 / USAM 9D) TaxID=929556 RepID=H8KP67_SOLCM|nr:class A beta-lactamase, subclass A2 [Solitalea canadensis]AFD05704.1 beta-lactamase class A [Solitalea canadensis DSM 3403]
MKNSKLNKILITFIISFVFNSLSAQQLTFKDQIDQIAKEAKGDVGVALLNLEAGDTFLYNETMHFPMQSVYKFPLAMAVLSQVDAGKLTIDQKLHLTKRDLLPNTWSPLREKYPNANADVTLMEVLKATVSESDNNGCDILFRLLGGPKKVEKYIHGIGVKEIAIAATEEEMHTAWDVQFTNWCTPVAMQQLLSTFHKDDKLSEKSKQLLWDMMVDSPTGAKRIKALLPEGTVVAHKTGTSDTNKEGVTGAINDVGIIVLPNKHHLAITVFVANSKASTGIMEETIAKIAKAAYDNEINKQ